MPSKKQPKGFFKYILGIDCETTGLAHNGDDPSMGHQSVSWGVLIIDTQTLKPIDEVYLEIKWNEESKTARKKDSSFGKAAEKIHGLTFEHLEKNGISEKEAVEIIGNLILKYWGPTNSISVMGHNVVSFDLPFLKKLFRSQKIELNFGNRHYCSSAIGFGAFSTFTSDELFNLLGFKQRGAHNALDDIKMSLATFRTVRQIVESVI